MSPSSSSSYVNASRFLFHFIQKRFLASKAVVDVKTLHNQSTDQKHASVLKYFHSLGFSDDHITKVVTKNPQCLTADVEKTLKPKIDCLLHYGFCLSYVIAAAPYILNRSLNSQLLPFLRLLHTYLGSNEKVVAAVKRGGTALLNYGNENTMERNVNFLVNEGVPLKSIARLISRLPRSMTQCTDRLAQAFESAKQFGFRSDDPMIVYAVEASLCMSESTMVKKLKFVKDLLGLSEEEVKAVFKRQPLVLNISEEKMKLVANFFVKTVGVEPSFVPSIPIYFAYSLEKRLVPRYNVWKTLESKKLLTKVGKFTATLKQSEKLFEANFVVKYLDEVPDLMDLYCGFRQTSNTQCVTATAK